MSNIRYVCGRINIGAINAGNTASCPIGIGGTGTGLTEAWAQWTVRNAGTFSNMTIRIISNGITATTTITFRVNTAAGNETISIGSGLTGEFTDSTHTDAVVATDIVNFEVAVGGTGTSIIPSMFSLEFDASSNTVEKLLTNDGTTYSTASTTFYIPPSGSVLGASGTLAINQFKFKTAGTLRYLGLYVRSNTTAYTIYVRTMINGVNGNGVVSIPSSTTGYFDDTSNTDSISIDDLVNYAVITDVGTTSFRPAFLCADFITTNDAYHLIASGGAGVAYGASTVGYVGIADRLEDISTESNRQAKLNGSYTLSNLEAYIGTNSVTATSTIRTRVNSGNGNQAVSIGSGATGYFEDTSNSDSITSSDDINYQIVAGSSGATITVNNIGVLVSGPSGCTTTITITETITVVAME